MIIVTTFNYFYPAYHKLALDINILRPTHFLKTNFLQRYGYTGLELAT